MSARLAIEPIMRDDTLVADLFIGTGDRLIVSFAGIGRDPDEVPPIEFAQTATRQGSEHALFISDPKRTWLNGPGLIEEIKRIVGSVVHELGVTRVYTLGHSMGGFMAAVMPGFMRVDAALCLSPQSSVHPDLVPDDDRWMPYRSKITKHRIRQVADHLSPRTQYFAIFGEHGREAPQIRGFLPSENLHLFFMSKTVHETAQKLKAAGVLDSLVEFAFDNRLPKVRRMLRRAAETYPVTAPMRFHAPIATGTDARITQPKGATHDNV